MRTSFDLYRRSSRLRLKEGISGNAERRNSVRFPIRMKLRFTVKRSKAQGPSFSRSGRCINISSQGILFTSTETLNLGEVLDGSIEWPVPQAGGTPMKLLWNGTVVRGTGGLVALQIAHWEFRTSSASVGTVLSAAGAS